MRASQVVSATRRKLRPAPKIEILPPLPLYRRILRAHQSLPAPQRLLGDSYVKSEFKLHKKVDNPVQIIAFLSQWQKYLEAIVGDKWQYEKLDMDTIQRMEPDKIVQLYELMVATRNDKSEYNAIPDTPEMTQVDLPRPESMNKKL